MPGKANEWNSGDNFGESMPALPIDQNGVKNYVLMGAIVEAGAIVKYLPIACTDNGDGTCTVTPAS